MGDCPTLVPARHPIRRRTILTYSSIIDRLSSSVPSDLPDLRESTNHLSPLNLPPQIAMYLPGRTDRVGFEVWQYSQPLVWLLLTRSFSQDSLQFPIIRAERGRLRKWLSTNIPVRWGCQVTRIEHDEQGVSVHLTDGSVAKGDFLVGADGINSVGKSTLSLFSIPPGMYWRSD